MKWLIALVSLSVLSSCSTKPWMVGSYNDVGCRKSKMGDYTEPGPIAEEVPVYSGKSGKDARNIMP